MGDRINVIVKQEEAAVVLYSHWLGSNMKGIIAEALNSDAGRNRRTHYNYLTRIIFCSMMKGYENDLEHGFGINAMPLGMVDAFIEECTAEDDQPPIVIDVHHQTVDGVNYRDFIAQELK